MATIVKHKETGKRYCLLGAGFGVFQGNNRFWNPNTLALGGKNRSR